MHPVNMKAPHHDSGYFKTIIAEHQPEYTPLPAIVDRQQGIVVTEWALDDEEREAIATGGRIRLYTVTRGAPFQPVEMAAVSLDDALTLEPVAG